MTKSVLDWASVVLAMLAAILAGKSAYYKIPDVPTKQYTGVSNVGVPGLVRAVRNQGWWTTLAAISAGLAALGGILGRLISN